MRNLFKFLTFTISISILVFKVSVTGFAESKSGGKLSPDIKSVIDAEQYKYANWGILVVDIESGQTIYELNADKMFRPASTTKLFTAAAALDALGADYRFRTPVYRRGEVSPSGELNGDLILAAGGDITMGGRTAPEGHIAYTDFDHTDANAIDGAILTKPDPLAGLDKLAVQVAKKGIKYITGEIIVDDRLFEKSKPDDPGCDFIRTPIMVNDNLIDFLITSTRPGVNAAVEWRPHTSAYEVDAQINTVAEDKPTRVEIKSPGPGRIVVRGQISAGSKPLVKTYSVSDPASFARSLFIEALGRAGVKTSASPLDKNPDELLPERDVYNKLSQVAVLESLPFSECLRMIMKVSHNHGADTLPLLIAVKNGKRTFEEGLLLEGQFFKRIGINPDSFSIGDGQGGVVSDIISPQADIELLSYMYKHPDFKKYYNALPILGVDGTLAASVEPDSPVRGKVHAKTGTAINYDGVNDRFLLLAKGLAGYMTTSKGRRLAFALYINNIHVDSIDEVMQVGNLLGNICEMIYQEIE